MKVALYGRVSKSDDSQNSENQFIRLRLFAESQGWTVYDEYVDRSSGANPDRPELERMMADARGNRFKCVVMTKIDRMARSTINLYEIIQGLADKQVGLVCIDQPEISTTKSMGKLLLAVLGGIAEFERDLISDRTKDGLARARAAGKRLGRPPMNVSTEEILKLKREGLTHKQVATRVGMSYQGVRKRLRAVGATKRGGFER